MLLHLQIIFRQMDILAKTESAFGKKSFYAKYLSSILTSVTIPDKIYLEK